MRCISRAKSAALVCVASISLFTGGCIGGKGATPVTAYELKNYNQDLYQGKLYAEELCVAQNDVALEAIQKILNCTVLHYLILQENVYYILTKRMNDCILPVQPRS